MSIVSRDEIAGALRRREFILYYQPKVSLTSNRIVGAEALVRWQRPDGTLLPASAFIGAVERAGLLKSLTRRLLPQLVHDLVDGGLAEQFQVSFNVCSCDLENSTLTSMILDAIVRRALPPAALELEITETQALQAAPCVLYNVQALTEAGIGLAMDDYGIGYSSIDTLSQWPFTTIKLDQGIVVRMLDSPKNATIVRSSIRLGHELGLEVVAEGVETLAQHDFLVEAGCGVAQGFLISRALPLAGFKAFCAAAGKCRGLPVGLVHMAIVDHVQWRRQLASFAIRRAALPPDAPLRQSAGHPTLCVTKCALGRWYLSEGRYFAGTPTYHALDAPHRRLHEIGARIVERIRAGASQPDIAPLMRELKQVSLILIGLLEDIEDAGFESLFTPAAAIHASRPPAAHAAPAAMRAMPHERP
ncbi:EAL domain-containing protein [Massilia sp. CFBP9012]|uniref:EAL domain-containing protein n=1 Tax=Massilia sp. CFBP9012 TaxID=3096531 RepID=UPI002A6B7D0C|nr:EAL domain-containing protein [Massilia sp. CFBP9012]MDY0976743.1 EAL domain-containing protein [Massilia sp. CFBP9012]